MMRWILLVISVLCFLSAAAVYLKNPVLPEEPLYLTREAAANQLEFHWKNYVSIDEDIDLGQRVYSTPVTRPLYSLRATDEEYRILDGDVPVNDLESYLGVVVSAPGRADLGAIRLQTVEEAVGEDEVLSERLLAPLDGTDYKVWVLSPLFQFQGEDQAHSWLARGSYRGALTRLMDLEENLDSSTQYHGLDDIEQAMDSELGIKLDVDMYVVLTDVETTDNYFLSPISGSNSVFVIMRKSLEDNPPRPVEGIMTTSDSAHYLEVGRLLDMSLPDAIGVISTGQTAAQYNKGTLDTIKASLFFGALALFFELIDFIRRTLAKRKITQSD